MVRLMEIKSVVAVSRVWRSRVNIDRVTCLEKIHRHWSLVHVTRFKSSEMHLFLVSRLMPLMMMAFWIIFLCIRGETVCWSTAQYWRQSLQNQQQLKVAPIEFIISVFCLWTHYNANIIMKYSIAFVSALLLGGASAFAPQSFAAKHSKCRFEMLLLICPNLLIGQWNLTHQVCRHSL